MKSALLTVVLWIAAASAAAAAGGFEATGKAHSDRPNIIVFLVDDLGWQDSSVAFWERPTAFQRHFHTPHLEQMARQGIRFTNAYSCAVCSPTRTSIMTGQNAARHRVTNWTLFADRDQSGQTERLAAPADWRRGGVQPQDVTLPALLHEAGYATIHCGKAHWGAYGTAGSDPTRLGFDVNIAGHPAGAPGSYQGRDNYGNHPDGTRRKPWGVPGLEQYYGTDTHLTDALASEACAAVRAALDDQKPFFLYMAPYAVHTPIQPHPRFVDRYRGAKYEGTEIDIPRAEADYASMVSGYDDALGQLLAMLREEGVAQRTLILFTSDNGGLSVHSRGTTPRGTGANTHCWPLREGKGSAYEGGTRVPLVVSWAARAPGQDVQQRFPIAAGSTCDEPIICEDIFPTVCRWAGLDDIARRAPLVDGRDATPWITGEGASSEPRPLLFHYPHVWGPRGDGYAPHSALRLGRWKVIHFYDDARWELYDLDDDIGETGNLAEAQPQRLAEMSERLIGELTAAGAQFPIDRQTGRPVPPQK